MCVVLLEAICVLKLDVCGALGRYKCVVLSNKCVVLSNKCVVQVCGALEQVCGPLAHATRFSPPHAHKEPLSKSAHECIWPAHAMTALRVQLDSIFAGHALSSLSPCPSCVYICVGGGGVGDGGGVVNVCVCVCW